MLVGCSVLTKKITQTLIVSRCRGFIDLAAHPKRAGKRVELLPKSSHIDFLLSNWLNGALSTTALRGKPKKIRTPLNVCNAEGNRGYNILKESISTITQAFIEKLRNSVPTTQARFDKIFFEASENLKHKACNNGLLWSFGRSQKFFNILLKYGFVVSLVAPEKLSKQELDLIKSIVPFQHAPVDSITLEHLRNRTDKNFLKGIYWGWNMTIEDYEKIRKTIMRFANEAECSPIAYETCKIWHP